MTTAVIGVGNIGGALARLWTMRGHTVWAGVRDTGSERARKLKEATGARITTVADAVSKAEIVALCVPWPAAQESLREAGGCSGKIIIDATNPVGSDLQSLEVGTTTSGGEMIANWAPRARVVKAFNTIGAYLFGNAQFAGLLADGYFCGDDVDAKSAVRPLIEAAGFEPVDVGPLRSARMLEPLALLWIDLKLKQGFAGDFGFKLLRRSAEGESLTP
ncbi:MAG TPA: NADPH-dependent F420 reductase [Bryobacteraceae bacterium]|nr:NADPH-dependent F420 reductase [Bryobacteraceae bacterium]